MTMILSQWCVTALYHSWYPQTKVSSMPSPSKAFVRAAVQSSHSCCYPTKVSSIPSTNKGVINPISQRMYHLSRPPMKVLSIPFTNEGSINSSPNEGIIHSVHQQRQYPSFSWQWYNPSRLLTKVVSTHLLTMILSILPPDEGITYPIPPQRYYSSWLPTKVSSIQSPDEVIIHPISQQRYDTSRLPTKL